MNNKLYTAVGRTQVKSNIKGQRYPMVILNNREYILDLQEMMLWTVLNWRRSSGLNCTGRPFFSFGGAVTDG